MVIFEFITTFLDFCCEFIFKFVNLFRIRDFKMVLEPIYFKIWKNILDFILRLKGISFSLYIIATIGSLFATIARLSKYFFSRISDVVGKQKSGSARFGYHSSGSGRVRVSKSWGFPSGFGYSRGFFPGFHHYWCSRGEQKPGSGTKKAGFTGVCLHHYHELRNF